MTYATQGGGRMPITVYLDETGTHDLEKIDPTFPVFGVVMLLCDETHYGQVIEPEARSLKREYFNDENVVFHSYKIRKQIGPFVVLENRALRNKFMADLTRFMTECQYRILAAVIHKEKHKAKYSNPFSPYDLAFVFTMERLVYFLEAPIFSGDASQQKEVTIIAESRGAQDKELIETFNSLVKSGSDRVSAERFKPFQLRFKRKAENVIGMQLADLAAYPIARFVMNSDQNNPAFDVLRPKLIKGLWLKVFP